MGCAGPRNPLCLAALYNAVELITSSFMVEGGVEVEGGDDLSPWPHLGTAEDVAKLAVYLASDDAEMATASMQVLDGGSLRGKALKLRRARPPGWRSSYPSGPAKRGEIVTFLRPKGVLA